MIREEPLWEHLVESLPGVVDTFGTPCYVYNAEILIERVSRLKSLFSDHFDTSYAVKANPNVRVLDKLSGHVDTFDVSSYAEIERVLGTGFPASRITFSGPAKKAAELRRAIRLGTGEIVVESIHEARMLSETCRSLDHVQDMLIRINPLRSPKNFGASMSGRAGQFGVDEEVLGDFLDEIATLPGLSLKGFHVYSGTNCLSADALEENFGIMIEVFTAAAALADIEPERLVFGSGFGVPYLPDEPELDVDALAARLSPMMTRFLALSRFENTRCSLELGRWLIGPAGLLLTSVVSEKSSRGAEIRLCDAGFNNHLAACGMMGSVIRRNWRMENLTSRSPELATYNLVGPLCTSIDLLARDIELPLTEVGDVLAIPMSGAYGLTSSPTRFISHPEPRELLVDGESIADVSESLLNHWTLTRG